MSFPGGPHTAGITPTAITTKSRDPAGPGMIHPLAELPRVVVTALGALVSIPPRRAPARITAECTATVRFSPLDRANEFVSNQAT